MAGAYVAKPDVVSMPDVPPGWNPNWPFPGATDPDYPGIDPDPFFPAPYPPGYTPTLTLVMTATDTIAYDGTATVTGSARDQATYATNEPSAITWKAKIGSTRVNLRFSGDEEYSSSLSSAVAFGTYWGATPSIEFELDEDNVGDVVTLTGYYTLDGVTVSQTEDITIAAITTLTMTWGTPTGITPNLDEEDLPETKFAAWLEIYDDATWGVISSRQIIYTQISILPSYDWQVDYEEDDDSVVVTVTDSGITMEMADISLVNGGSDFRVFLRITSSGDGCNNTAVVELTIDGETTDLNLAVSVDPEVTGDYHDPWVTINAETGEVTVNNP